MRRYVTRDELKHMEILLSGFVIFFLVLFWALPIVMITRSQRTSGGTKLLWILAVIFISWFAWLAYILLVPKKEPEKRLINS
jgi:hypothetical protein